MCDGEHGPTRSDVTVVSLDDLEGTRDNLTGTGIRRDPDGTWVIPRRVMLPCRAPAPNATLTIGTTSEPAP